MKYKELQDYLYLLHFSLTKYPAKAEFFSKYNYGHVNVHDFLFVTEILREFSVFGEK